MNNAGNLLDIFKHLPKTNCRQCGVMTCLAFADAVIKGGKRIDDCPHVSSEVIALFEGNIGERESVEKIAEEAVERLKAEVATTGIASIAGRLGAPVIDGRLPITSLGKKFYISSDGNVSSECHTAVTWLTIPMLGYALYGGGREVAGRWVTFEGLPGGGRWGRLFGQRCEKEFKELADGHPGLFGDITGIFSGTASGGDIQADVSLVLNPFPRLPVLICYWKQESDFESKLKIYFDQTAEDNLDIESIYTLCVGLVMMFGKIASRHK